MKLVIFDLDQTLVDVIVLHDEATDKLFRKWFGVSAKLTELDFAGKSQLDNLIELAEMKGIPEDKARQLSRELLNDYEKIFAGTIPSNASGYVLPGARQILEALSKTDNFVVLYTGSSAGVVKAVLAATGLARYFKFCFYGTEVKERADMVRDAISRAEKLMGRKFENKEIIIIGDSVRDIDCGRQFNALTIAVATGFHSREQLLERKPDHLFDSLKSYKQLLAVIG